MAGEGGAQSWDAGALLRRGQTPGREGQLEAQGSAGAGEVVEWGGGPWGLLADSGVQAEQPHSWLSTALLSRAAKNLLPREEGPARREDTSGPGLRWRVPGLAEPENCSQASGARSEWAVTQKAGHVRTGWETP